VCVDDYDVGAALLPSQFGKAYGANAAKNFIATLESVASLGRERGFAVIVGVNVAIPPAGLLTQINAGRTGLLMRPNDYPPGTLLLGMKLPMQSPGGQPPVGRALMVIEGAQQWVQVARSDLNDLHVTNEEDVSDEREYATNIAMHRALD
jgi:hypothetical protein